LYYGLLAAENSKKYRSRPKPIMLLPPKFDHKLIYNKYNYLCARKYASSCHSFDEISSNKTDKDMVGCQNVWEDVWIGCWSVWMICHIVCTAKNKEKICYQCHSINNRRQCFNFFNSTIISFKMMLRKHRVILTSRLK
jgi:hypothetical protein